MFGSQVAVCHEHILNNYTQNINLEHSLEPAGEKNETDSLSLSTSLMTAFQETSWFKVKYSRVLKQQVVKLVLIIVDNEVLGFDAFEDGNDAGLQVVEEERLFPTREVLS